MSVGCFLFKSRELYRLSISYVLYVYFDAYLS